ncbi:hypothetical protein AURDEDRAFT_116563 [Auricularia subglabra TFB-10046 SS5]|nr:hypothetical protein AURDEDRAFT_116563 [Auricularia subglabra TFB-10046 SS5]
MSTVSGTESTFTPRPTRQGGSGAAGSGGAPSISAPSSLYLITFAVTLSLLLSVSCAILARNVVLRARERRLRAAVAAGLIIEPELAVRHGIGLRAGAARVLGERPVRWDAWMPLDEKHTPPDWPDFIPVSVAPLQLPSATAPPSPPPPPPPPLRRTLFERIFQLPPLPRIPPAGAQQQDAGAKADAPRIDLESLRGVRIAVLVAMPTQHRHDAHGELPEVLFGTSDIVWRNRSSPPTP